MCLEYSRQTTDMWDLMNHQYLKVAVNYYARESDAPGRT